MRTTSNAHFARMLSRAMDHAGPPTNADRADWARRGLENWRKNVCRTDREDVLADFLCDVMHLCEQQSDAYGTFERALFRAQSNYAAEKEEERENVEAAAGGDDGAE